MVKDCNQPKPFASQKLPLDYDSVTGNIVEMDIPDRLCYCDSERDSG